MPPDKTTLSYGEKIQALRRVARYRPAFSSALVVLGTFVAFLEGIGLSFIYPIIQTAKAQNPTNVSGPIMEVFVSVYKFLNIPFSLGYLIIGVALVMTVRYTMSFLVGWLAAVLGKNYERELRTRAFDRALDAEVSYYDSEGTDDILNSIITETRFSGRVLRDGIVTLQTIFLVLMYAGVMFYTSQIMTIFAVIVLGSITFIIRFVVEPAVTVGDRVAEANESVQEIVQAGTQGIRDVKLFGLRSEIFNKFSKAINNYTKSGIKLRKNKVAIQNFFELSAAISIFIFIYVGFKFTGLSLGEIGIFLIAMFQLAPKVSSLNTNIYNVEGYLSHTVRTHDFLDQLDMEQENDGDKQVSEVSRIKFKNVEFSYEDEQVLSDISFEVNKNEFVGFVGQSGAGKSTIVSLLARMYDPDRGDIRADGVPISQYDIKQWRGRIAVVRQHPYIFTDTLENNVTIGNRDASRDEIKRACEIAKVDEFIDELPNGYESQLGDDGVRLSGGQRQRVALARALLKDADFLVLDEATSDLDSNLEKQVQTSIESMNREYGVITIAHRLSTVKNADRIYTIEDGEIIETGRHKQLLEKEGEYADLYAIQSKS